MTLRVLVDGDKLLGRGNIAVPEDATVVDALLVVLVKSSFGSFLILSCKIVSPTK